MNSYNLNISSSWIIAVISFLIAAVITYYYYKPVKITLNKTQRYLLMALRALALSLLLFILFEPVFSMIKGKIIEPQIAVLLDNSLSMAINDGKYDRKQIYKNILKSNSFLEKNENTFLVFDNTVKKFDSFNIDSLKLNGQLTDLSRPIDYLINQLQNTNIKAVVVVSDGAFNSGLNPLYLTEKLGLPVYAVGVGDTSIPKDIIVSSVITNENAQLFSTVPVNVNIKAFGFTQRTINISLYDNGEKISTQAINLIPGQQAYNLLFEYLAKHEGIRKITAKADELADEVSIKNNQMSEFINVISKKKKITVFSGAPSPDLTFILNALSKDNTVVIKKFIQKYKADFYDKTPGLSDIQNTDIFYLIGFPNSSTPVNIIQMIKAELEKGKPLFIIASLDMDYTKLKPIEYYLPFNVLSSNNREYVATVHFNEKARLSPLMHITVNDDDINQWNDLPPLYRTELFVKVKPESEVLANLKINTSILNESMILTRQLSNQRTVAILGYGIYRWKLSGYAQEQYHKNTNKADLFTKFVGNCNQWLTTDADKKNIIIRPVKRVFQQNEKVEFYAQVNDAAMNPVDNAEVKVNIYGGNKDFEITLNSLGNGRYTGFAEKIEHKEYYYKGRASKNGTILGVDKGRFDVGELAIEYLDTRMNIELLKQIANSTGGKFYFNEDVKNLENDIRNNKNFIKDDITIKSEFALWNYPLLLALSLLLFAIEWFLRKRFGLL